jgi:hypothetical protein
MAHIWIKNKAQQWAVLQLRQTALALTPEGPKPIDYLTRERALPASILLLPTGEADCKWVLVAGSTAEVSINGLPLVAGIRVLSDKDEISFSSLDSYYYYSSESLAKVENFPASEQTLFCPRCKQEITDGELAVRCPACKVWHHETEELNCWTYSDGCALCAHPTEMNASFRWTPEEL